MPHDRDLSPKPTASEPSSAAVVSESPAASESTTFTSSGPVPPVASSAGSSAPAPPSASERAYGAASGPGVAAGPVVAPADAMVTRLNSGDLDEHQLNQLTPDQVAQVDSAGAAPRNILQRAMHESWHHAKEVLLAPGGNAPARQALMRKLWEFRQWHHELILQRTKDDPSLGKDGLKEWKSAGSKTLTSDIDVNLKGTKTEQAVAVFNRKFKADGGGWAHEAGVVYDVNVYALDFMHKDTFSGLAEEGGEISPHKFGQTDAASGAPLPDPATRGAAKEGAREGSAGGGVGAHSDILGPRMVQADAGLQRVWSLVKMRLYMTGAEWAEYVRDAQVPEAGLEFLPPEDRAPSKNSSRTPQSLVLGNALDAPANRGDGRPPSLLGAYWFRLGSQIRSGMPRMVRWPRKTSDQNVTANEELALAA